MDPRQTLLEAGERLFSRYGFDATGVSEVTEEAGTSIGLLIYHFGSKEGLLAAIVQRRAVLLGWKLSEMPPAGATWTAGDSRLAGAVATALSFVYTHVGVVRLVLHELTTARRPALRRAILRSLQPCRDLLAERERQAVREGVLPAVAPDGRGLEVEVVTEVMALLIGYGGGLNTYGAGFASVAGDGYAAFAHAAAARVLARRSATRPEAAGR